MATPRVGRRRLDAALRLLDDVRELVAEQLPAARAVGIVLAGREVDVGAAREGARADRGGLRPLVDAHRREVGAERALHLAAHGLGERLPAAGALRAPRPRARRRPPARSTIGLALDRRVEADRRGPPRQAHR